MKKIFALILAIVMIASMSVVVFAEETTDKAAGALENGTVLVYGVAQDYIVEIPETQMFAPVDIDDLTKGYEATAVVKASGVKIAANELFTITVSSEKGWVLVDTEGENGSAISEDVPYDALVGGQSIKATGKVLDCPDSKNVKGAEKSETITFTTAGTGQEGTYKDTLTFTVAIGIDPEHQA